MVPKGKLIIIGGAININKPDEGEFTVPQDINFFERGILKRIALECAVHENPRIEIITTASLIPELVGSDYIAAYKQLGEDNVGVINIANREEANSTQVAERIGLANAVVFSGGDQLRLTSILGGTLVHRVMLKKYQEENFIVAGTSAGAAASSSTMIYQGASKNSLHKGEVKITGGLGFINNVIVDTHFIERGRIGRLLYAAASSPGNLGIGLGEDTGLYITQGTVMEAIGSGMVILVDGTQMADTNITDVEMGHPISIKNMIVHVLSDGDVYNLADHSLVLHHPKTTIVEETI